MKTSSVIVAFLGAPSLVSAAICNNNCGRAVAGTARQSPPFAARQSLCEAFVSATVTVTPGAVTVTANPVARRNVHAPRQAAPVITGAVPAYASACADVSAYWSACQCFSVFLPTTVTVTAVTPIVTVTRSVQSSSVVESSSVAESSSSFVTITQVSSSTRTSTITSTVVSSVESSAEASSTEASSTEASSTDTSTSTGFTTIETPSSSSASSVESSSSTTPSADSTTVSIGSTCTPTPVLPTPTSLISGGDDLFASALLPFPIGVFGSYETTVYASSNGFLSLYGGSGNFGNVPLPSSYIPDVSILPFWDDLFIAPGQVVQYQVFGSNAGSRNVTFEWVTEHYGEENQFYHFTVTFEEAQPGIVTYRYYTTYDKGGSATVGVQNLRNGNSSSVQVGFNTLGSVPDRTFIRLDTTGAGNFTTGAFETTEC